MILLYYRNKVINVMGITTVETVKTSEKSGVFLYPKFGGKDMLSIYTSYKCRTCSKEFILLTEDIDNMDKNKYVACPYCNSKRVSKQKETDDLRECMKERSYKKINGAIRQLR